MGNEPTSRVHWLSFDALLDGVDGRALRLLLVGRELAEPLQQLGDAAGLAEEAGLGVFEVGWGGGGGEVGFGGGDEGGSPVGRERGEQRPETRARVQAPREQRGHEQLGSFRRERCHPLHEQKGADPGLLPEVHER